MSTHWTKQSVSRPDQNCIEQAKARQNCLTKPPGSLGQLEQLAIRLSGLLGEMPSVDKTAITIFAGDHGVAKEGVSAFPQVVTGEMVKNFSAGGAAICVLARCLDADLEVVNLGTVNDPGALPGVVDAKIASSTANLSKTPAMEDSELELALNAGFDAITRAAASGTNLFIGGDMGIANTTSATALGCAFTGCTAVELTGPGTGLNAEGVAHKAGIVTEAMTLHESSLSDPLETLRCLGGFEIAALTGAYIRAAQVGMPVLVDGFIASSAALAAVRINPDVSHWLFLSHCSAEPGHQKMVDALGLQPLIDLGMRLGEGSGAAVTVPLLRMACRLHNEMATFAQAGVSEQ